MARLAALLLSMKLQQQQRIGSGRGTTTLVESITYIFKGHSSYALGQGDIGICEMQGANDGSRFGVLCSVDDFG